MVASYYVHVELVFLTWYCNYSITFSYWGNRFRLYGMIRKIIYPLEILSTGPHGGQTEYEQRREGRESRRFSTPNIGKTRASKTNRRDRITREMNVCKPLWNESTVFQTDFKCKVYDMNLCLNNSTSSRTNACNL